MSMSMTLVFLFIVKNRSQFMIAGASAAVRISCTNKVRRGLGENTPTKAAAFRDEITEKGPH